MFIKKIVTENIEKELICVGYDNSHIFKAKEKFDYVNLKVFELSCTQANILKQTALSVGADCATNKNVITNSIDLSNCILGGSLSQLHKISQKLKSQPFGLKDLAFQIEKLLKNKNNSVTKIMGILNLTQNSFSDGGLYYDYEAAITHLNELIQDGADIIDIGAESTKPFSSPVSSEEQLKHILPILKYINKNNITIPISIDTRSAKVALECINFGAAIINDVSGFDYDIKMADVIADNPSVKIILQHSQGTPETMQNNPTYSNLMDEIFINLRNKVEFALDKNILQDNIIIDPGIGFGKTRENNFEIINRWQELKTIGVPVLIGLSRKSLLNMPNASNEEKDMYSLALDSILIKQNIDYIRVHNVKIHKQFLELFDNKTLS